MRIGIDAKRLFFNFTGLGNYGRQFVHALVAGLEKTDEIILFCPKPIEKSAYSTEFSSKNISLNIPGGWKKWFGGSFWRSFLMQNELAKNRVDCFYGISNELPFGPKLLGLKKVVIIHDLIFARFPEHYPAFDVHIYNKKTRHAVNAADQIIAVSGQTEQDLIDFYGVPKEMITVIPPICDEIYYSAKNNLPKNILQGNGKKYILNVGSVTPRKNLLLAIEAYSAIEKKHDLDFVVVGTAVGAGKAYLEKIRQSIRRDGLENRVHFLGKVDKHALPAIYAGAEFMVYPSVFEGFGMPIAESLFCGTPVISSTGSCFEEAGGPGAVYIEPNNLKKLVAAMDDLAGNEGLRARLAEAGLAHVQQFKAAAVGQKIAGFHKKLTNGL